MRERQPLSGDSGCTNPFCVKLLQASGDNSHLVNLVRIAATGQVVDRSVQTLQNRAVSFEAAQTLCDLVADVR